MSIQVAESPVGARTGPLVTFAVLTKARLNSLVAVTALAGAALAPGGTSWGAILGATLGTTLAALGACALNQVVERERDALMDRTWRRPLPAGDLRPATALAIALGLLIVGVAAALAAGPLPAALTLLGGGLYAFAYTPLKPVTALAFVPGAVAGALPPVVGWVAAGGGLDGGALALAALLIAWQVPHVAAIDWVHRADHRRGGLRTLAVLDPSGARSGLVAVVGAVALVLVSAAPALLGGAPAWAGALAGALGLPLVVLAERLLRARSDAAARRLFLASLVHLPAVLAVAIVARHV